jgi:hypothetical protein
LRAAIARALERSTVRVVVRAEPCAPQMPPNPLYAAVLIQSRGELRATRAGMNGDMIRLDGQGTQTNNVSIEGNCRMTGGTPYTIATRGGLDTDGLTATLRYTIEGTLPGLGMQCRVPGMGQGYGMSMPVPVDNARQCATGTTFPLRDGAELVFDMAQSQAAQIVAGSGVRITGQAKLRLGVPRALSARAPQSACPATASCVMSIAGAGARCSPAPSCAVGRRNRRAPRARGCPRRARDCGRTPRSPGRR